MIINSSVLANDILDALGLANFGPKFDKIRLPRYEQQSLTWSFIRGLFDSDGHVTDPYFKSPAASICSMSANILEDIKRFTNTHTIDCRILYPNIKFYGADANYFLNNIYSYSAFHLQRKYEKYLIHKTWSFRKGNFVKSYN